MILSSNFSSFRQIFSHFFTRVLPDPEGARRSRVSLGSKGNGVAALLPRSGSPLCDAAAMPKAGQPSRRQAIRKRVGRNNPRLRPCVFEPSAEDHHPPVPDAEQVTPYRGERGGAARRLTGPPEFRGREPCQHRRVPAAPSHSLCPATLGPYDTPSHRPTSRDERHAGMGIAMTVSTTPTEVQLPAHVVRHPDP